MQEIRARLESGFYGDLTFKFVGGRLVAAEVRETKKPPA